MSRSIPSMFAAVALGLAFTLSVRADAPAAPTTAPAMAPSSPKAKGAKGAKGVESDGLDLKIMQAQLKLPDDQVAKMKPLFKAKAADLNTWETTSAAHLADLQKAVKTAKSSGDKDAAKDAREQINTVNGQRKQIVFKDDAAIKASLTPDQLKTWTAYDLVQHELDRLGKAVTLTDAQKTDMNTRAVQEVPAMISAADTDAVEAERKNFHTIIKTEVLTEDQAAALKKAGKRSKKAAGGDSDSN